MNRRLTFVLIVISIVSVPFRVWIFDSIWWDSIWSAIFFFLIFHLWMRYNSSRIRPSVNPDPEKNGFVADESTALKVEEIIWLSVYGGTIYQQKPFKAILQDDVWIVEGVAHAKIGGAPHIVIRKKDGAIMEVSRINTRSIH